MPSLYQFSTVDATLIVDYSRDVGIGNGVVNSPPPRLVAHTYALSPPPLSKEKRTLVRLGHLSPSRDDGVARCGPSWRLRTEAPGATPPLPASFLPPQPPPWSSALRALIPPLLFNNAIVRSAPDAPVDAPLVPIIPCMDIPKAKVPFLNPKSISRRCFPCLACACR